MLERLGIRALVAACQLARSPSGHTYTLSVLPVLPGREHAACWSRCRLRPRIRNDIHPRNGLRRCETPPRRRLLPRKRSAAIGSWVTMVPVWADP